MALRERVAGPPRPRRCASARLTQAEEAELVGVYAKHEAAALRRRLQARYGAFVADPAVTVRLGSVEHPLTGPPALQFDRWRAIVHERSAE